MSLPDLDKPDFDEPDFDEIVPQFGTHSMKWDMMESLYGLSPDRGLAMWVADMDFRPPAAVQAAVQRMADHGIYGYFGDERAYLDAIRWWMATRHGWEIRAEAITTTHGVVNGVGLALQAFTAPGDAVLLFTPVYHAFARIIRAAGRQVTECPLAHEDGRYAPDFTDAAARLTGRERMLILCSPHNPGGRVWTRAELTGFAALAEAHDLILVSDEIHQDLVYPGHRHLVLETVAPEIRHRLVTMTAATKTFNIAGILTGNVIIDDAALRTRFRAVLAAFGISPNSFGLHMATAAYSPEGAAWVDALMAYLDRNRRIFEAGIAAIPGLRPMALEATYLAWVDGSGTGMPAQDFIARIERDAGIAPSRGAAFGAGGEGFARFNIGMPRAQVEAAVARLQAAFADLQ